MSKKRVLPIILTILIWGVMYYYYLPAMNIHSQETWMFFTTMAVVAVVVNAFSIVQVLFLNGEPEKRAEYRNKYKKFIVIPIGLAVIYFGGTLISSPILRASSYSELLNVQSGDFTEDITEVDYSKIPILDSDSASRLAEREMGSMVDMVSQYEVSAYFNQINYLDKPIRVTPLKYGDVIKWITNRSTGIPGYISIDMTTQDVELVRLEDGIMYSPAEYFGRNLYRHVRFNYPTAMIYSTKFEIDEEGTPYWVCAVEDKTIGLFGGTDIIGAILVNAQTGEHQYYDVADVPNWVDQVYDASLLVAQYDYYGTLKNGFINSMFGQRDCLQSTEGYNYIALEGDVWVYTGVTSIGADESNVGFVLMNCRTKETKYYLISGAKEISAMSSAEGQVQHLGYTATFPILLNIAGEPTYFLSLKDAAGLVKQYAMVNIQKYQIVATGDTVGDCEAAYRNLMQGSGIETATPVVESHEVEGIITVLADIVVDGNTVYLMQVEDDETLYQVVAKDHMEIVTMSVGDQVEFEFAEDGNGGSVVVELH
ncbi:CvpA family protein [Chakrabartyella piscis]|uniref:CvpA family protein n=1 Tax=Chakrabartyella piscis TaxID=2918914 RepID=UPI0029584251|nr:CvpA family protein [Chakrabartyella piscis]